MSTPQQILVNVCLSLPSIIEEIKQWQNKDALVWFLHYDTHLYRRFERIIADERLIVVSPIGELLCNIPVVRPQDVCVIDGGHPIPVYAQIRLSLKTGCSIRHGRALLTDHHAAQAAVLGSKQPTQGRTGDSWDH